MTRNLAVVSVAVLLLLPFPAQARFLGAEIEPDQPRPGETLRVIIHDDPLCRPYTPDDNGVTHDLRRQGMEIELDVMFGSVCAMPSDEVNQHDFSAGTILTPGEYDIRVYAVQLGLGGPDTFPVSPMDRELVYETSIIVGGEPMAVPTYGWLGFLVMLGGVLIISFCFLCTRNVAG